MYKITRWDAVLFGDDINPKPMIYFKPDLKFLNFARDNRNYVNVRILNTDSPYDHSILHGVVDISAYVPICRPNYFEETGYYVITLDCNWMGYPHLDKLGSVKIIGLNEEDEEKKQPKIEKKENFRFSNTKITENKKNKKDNTMTNGEIILIIASILILIGGVWLIAYVSKHK